MTMYAKTLMKTGLLALAAALALTGCAGDGGKRGKTTPPPAAQTPAALPGGGEIAIEGGYPYAGGTVATE